MIHWIESCLVSYVSYYQHSAFFYKEKKIWIFHQETLKRLLSTNTPPTLLVWSFCLHSVFPPMLRLDLILLFFLYWEVECKFIVRSALKWILDIQRKQQNMFRRVKENGENWNHLIFTLCTYKYLSHWDEQITFLKYLHNTSAKWD